MKIRFIQFFLVLTICCIGGHFCYGQIPAYENLTTEDGLPSNTIYDMLQDSKGYMWFATGAGVSRFDGRRFTNYAIKDGLTELDILKLYEDSKGRIWFMGLNGATSFWLNGKIYNEDEVPFLKELKLNCAIMSMAEAGDGTIWIGSTFMNYASLSTDNKVTLFKASNTSVNFFANDAGEMFLMNENLRYQLKNDNWVFIDSIQSCSTHCLSVSDKNLHYAIAMGCDGMYSFSDSSTFTKLFPLFGEITHVNGGFSVDSSGDIFIRSTQGGVYMLINKNNSYLPIQHVFKEYCINRGYKDDEGNLWFSTSGNGAFFVPYSALRGEVLEDGHPELKHSIGCVEATQDGDLILGMNNGAVYSIEKGNLKCIAPVSTSVSSYILNIATNLEEVYYCNNEGIYARHRESNRLILIEDRSKPGKYSLGGQKSILYDRMGNIYSSNNGFYKLNRTKGNFDAVVIDKLPGDRIYSPYFDYDNNLWFECGPVLYQYDGKGDLKEYAGFQSQFRGKITGITQLDRNTILICTYGNGLHAIRNDSLVFSFASGDGLASDICGRMKVYNDTLLVSTNGGLSVLKYENQGLRLLFNLTKDDGLPTNDVKGAVMVGSVIYLATSKGLFNAPILYTKQAGSPPRIYLSALNNFQGQTLNPNGFTLTAGEANFNLSFNVISFNSHSSLMFRYKLHDNDEWSESSDAEFSFTSLSPGDYHFQICAKKNDSDWGPPFIVPFKIEMPWYKKPLTILGGILVVAILSVLIMAYFFKRRNERASIELNRLEGISKERLRIAADVHDDLGADLSNLLLESRIAAIDKDISEHERVQLKKFEMAAQSALVKVDEIIWSLDPKEDNLGDFQAYLHKYFEEFLLLSGIKGGFEFTSDSEHVNITSGQRRQLYLCVKEMLHNIQKHANASVVIMEVTCKLNEINILIDDNGVGILVNLPEVEKKGHGLSNIKKRMEMINGVFVIYSDKDGTHQRLSLGLD